MKTKDDLLREVARDLAPVFAQLEAMGCKTEQDRQRERRDQFVAELRQGEKPRG